MHLSSTEAPNITDPVDSQQFSTNELTNITFNCTALGFPVPSILFSYEEQNLTRTEGRPDGEDLPLVDRVQVGMEEVQLMTSTGLYEVTRTLTLFDADGADSGVFNCSAVADIPEHGVISDSVSFSLTVFGE